MTQNEHQRLGELITKFANDLGEHVDAVQIMACVHDHDGSSSFYCGTGNWFARFGLAHEFIEQENAEITGKGVARELNKE